VSDIWLHDLRRTVGSGLANSGKSLLLIDQTLNRKSTLSTESYACLALDPVRDAQDEHVDEFFESMFWSAD
jgi:hypothetical protein